MDIQSAQSSRRASRLFAVSALVGSFFILSLSGCTLTVGLFEDEERTSKALGEVVDAIQYAVDEAATDDVWLATKVEREHWDNACKAARSGEAKACSAMLDSAIEICSVKCPGGQCNFAVEERCRRFANGQDRAVICPSGDKLQSAWCTNAGACTRAREQSAERCGAAASIRLPRLKQAYLSLAVEEGSKANASVNFMLVSFGGGRTRTTTNTVEMTLLPRVRSVDYGSDILPKLPDARDLPEDTKKLAAQLKSMVVEAVRSTVREQVSDQQGNKVAARPPMAIGQLQINFSLIIDENGGLGLKKEFDIPAGFDLSGGGSIKQTNVLKIIYAQPD